MPITLTNQLYETKKNLPTQETKNLQKLQNAKIQNSCPSDPFSTPNSQFNPSNNNSTSSFKISKKTIPYKSRFKGTANSQKFDFRRISNNYQLKIINKKVLVSAVVHRGKSSTRERKIRKFNFVLPESCDTETFTHRINKGILEFKWKTLNVDN